MIQTNKEKIRQETETIVSRRLNRLRGEWFELEEETEGIVNELLSLIFSAPQEPEEADKIIYQGEVYTRAYADELDEFANKYIRSVPKPEKRYAKYSEADMVISVKAGAQFQKQQMMKDAVVAQYHGYVMLQGQTFVLWDNIDLPFEPGDKLKVLIIREE